MFKNPQNLKGLTVNLVQGLFKQCSRVQIFLLFCRTKPYMDSSYTLWNKFQDYQLRFILTNQFLQLYLSFVGQLESSLLTARQHGSYNSHINIRFSDTLGCTVIVVQ